VGSGGVCLKTCASSAQCSGKQTCMPATDSTGTALGYSICA
jgi:hypothetical protein